VVLLEGGADAERDLRRAGAEVVRNPDIDLPVVPQTANRPEETALVHCYRLIIPEIERDDPYPIYMDADALILKDLSPLRKQYGPQEHPVAATRSNAPLCAEIKHKSVPKGIYGFITSLLVFNRDLWMARDIFGEFRRAAQDDEWEYLTGDQACLNRVLYKDWTGMPLSIQAHAGHMEARVCEAFILHFLGTNPWDEVPQHLLPYPGFKLNARKLWREYYKEGAGVDFHMDVCA
jgi:lipopolysaccharide biosynthesis glycosyltransferase